MSQSSSESQPATTRPGFSPGTLIAVGLWACVFAIFIVLGLRS
jgi:uncharacterized OsmC-like protein